MNLEMGVDEVANGLVKYKAHPCSSRGKKMYSKYTIPGKLVAVQFFTGRLGGFPQRMIS